jgi:hypothetical protein
MSYQTDSYRFVSGITKRLVRTWIDMEQPRPIPWTPARPLRESTVALVSSGAIALKTDRPFDQEGERRDPWWGDPSFRRIPRHATAADIRVWHLHINPEPGEQDINCLLPLERGVELEAEGIIGRFAPTHYSYMGYLLEPEQFLAESVPAMIAQMQAEGVDSVVLIPA